MLVYPAALDSFFRKVVYGSLFTFWLFAPGPIKRLTVLMEEELLVSQCQDGVLLSENAE